MQLNRQIINLLGVVVVAAILAAGILLGAMPLYFESRATQAQADEVARASEMQEVQVQALRRDAERIDEIEADLAALRAQIPADPRLDDVFALVNRAAQSAGVTISSAMASDPEPWTKRTAPGADPAAPAAPAAPDQPAGAADASGEAAPVDPAAGATAPEGADAAAIPPAAAQTAPETQVPVSIVVVAGDTASAARFAEALGDGPRLLGITHANMTSATDGYTLTLDALAFVRTEQ